LAVQIVENMVEVPEGVTLSLEDRRVVVSGEKGRIQRDFSHVKLAMGYTDNVFRVWAENPRKREASLVNTVTSHVKNMVKGVTEGFTYRMKIVFIHFPMTVRTQGRNVVIENFIGERAPRTAKIRGNVQVRVEGDDLIIEGTDIEEVSQTAANIQQATRIKNKDLRKFLDGIYVYATE